MIEVDHVPGPMTKVPILILPDHTSEACCRLQDRKALDLTICLHGRGKSEWPRSASASELVLPRPSFRHSNHAAFVRQDHIEKFPLLFSLGHSGLRENGEPVEKEPLLVEAEVSFKYRQLSTSFCRCQVNALNLDSFASTGNNLLEPSLAESALPAVGRAMWNSCLSASNPLWR